MLERSMSSEFLEQAGLRSLTFQEQGAVSSHYRQEILAGLSGRKSSVMMFSSQLSPIELTSLKEGTEALVVEIGGTNLYGARVQIQDGKPQIVDPPHRDLLPTIEFVNAQDFYERVAKGVKPVLTGRQPSAIGIVYSFPGEAVLTQNGVDVISPEELPKDFKIPGISKIKVGEAFKDILHVNYGLNPDTPTVVLNDTVAVLFSSGAKIGGGVGTGFNLAMQTPKGIINSESGGFAIRPTNRFAQKVDAESGNAGKQLAEKQVAGLYLGKQLEAIVKELGFEALFNTQNITAITISKLLEYQDLDPRMLILKQAAKRLRDRSSQIVGTMIGTVINAFPEIFIDERIEVPIEGSLFWMMPGYKDRVTSIAEELTRKRLHFLNINQAGRIGAAVAALGFVK